MSSKSPGPQVPLMNYPGPKLLYGGWSLAPETGTEEVPKASGLTQAQHPRVPLPQLLCSWEVGEMCGARQLSA